MSRRADVLEILLPKAAPALSERARRVTTFLRLLAADARPAPAGRVRVDLDRARSVFERDRDRSCVSLLTDLLRAHLEVALGPESFCWSGPIATGASEAWGALGLLREEWPWLPQVPAPGERALAVCARLLAGLDHFAEHAPDASLWKARMTRAGGGPAAGVAAFHELIEAPLEIDHAGATAAECARARALEGLLECQLDAGLARRARVDFADHADSVRRLSDHPRLLRLGAWVGLLCEGPSVLSGDVELATLASQGPLPTPLVELREREPAFLPNLPGVRAPGPALEPELADPPARGAFGAAFLGVFALDPGGALRTLHLDLAPALEARVTRWLEDREGACSQPAQPEHRLVVEARPVVVHLLEGARPRAGVLSDGALALALEPILDASGEVAGWLHVELEHHLVPTARCLRSAAAAWGRRLLPAHAGAAPVAGDEPRHRQLPRRSGATPDPTSGPTPESEVFRRAVESLGLKLTQRRWWGFVVQTGAAQCVATGGGGLARSERSGAARGVDRALRCGGLVRFDEPDARLSVHGQAASGICLPLFCRGRIAGVLAVESSRRRDFGTALAARFVERAVRLGSELRTAQFRAWHSRRYGHDVHFEPSGFVDELMLVGRARAPVAVLGPGGCGKRVVARWVHFESDRREGPLVSHACGFEDGDEFPGPELLARAAAGTLVLHDIERLSEANQVHLGAHLGRADLAGSPEAEGPRVVVTSTRSLAESVQAGALRADLCRRLERLAVAVPPLAEHREQLPGLIVQLVARFAAEESVPAPRLDDAALACLWRQPWPGNVRQLENVVFKLVITAARSHVGASATEAVLRASTGECLTRIASRRPERSVVLAALRTTRTGRGSLNKTRASLYLGWDPDTLVLRMAELELDERSLEG